MFAKQTEKYKNVTKIQLDAFDDAGVKSSAAKRYEMDSEDVKGAPSHFVYAHCGFKLRDIHDSEVDSDDDAELMKCEQDQYMEFLMNPTDPKFLENEVTKEDAEQYAQFRRGK